MIKRTIARLLPQKILDRLQAPYVATEYEKHFYKVDHGMANRLLSPYRRRRDERLFREIVRSTDVFLVGHPKSGNTWIAYMLAVLISKDKDHRVTMANVGNFIPVVHGRDSHIAAYAHLPNPRIFRNEYTVHSNLYPKTIYLVRDPRAALLSYYHMYRTIFIDTPVTLEAFIDEYLANGYVKTFEPLVRWDRQVHDWTERAKYDERILILKYEDMVTDRRTTFEKVAQFCRINYSEEDLAVAVARGSFEAMRRDEEEHGAESYPGASGKGGRFIRRGKTDGWKDELNQSLTQKIEKEFSSVMKTMGYF